MDLSQIFNEGQFSLVKPGMDAFNLEQQKQQANLAGLMGQEQRAQQMFPAELQSKQAYANQAQAQADTMNDARQSQLPPAERAALAMAEHRKKMTDAQASEEDQKMYRRGQFAAMAMKNGGVLPLELMSQLDESERKFFANPKSVQTTALLTKAWHDSHPKTMEARAKEQAALERALAVARETSNRVASGKTPSGGTDDASMTRDLLKLKTAGQKLAQLKVYWPQLSEEQKAKWTPVAEDLLAQANEEARTGTAGKMDVGGATKGQVPVNPNVNLGAPSGAAANRPQRQADQKMTSAKLQELYPGVPLDKLKELYKKKFGVDVQ